MTDTNLTLVCPSCQAINRVPAARLAASPRCGSCHAPLFDGHPLEVDDARFDRHVQHDQIPVLADLWAPWCGPCRAMTPAFINAAARLEPRYRLIKLNADTAPAILARYGVRSIPTLLLFQNGALKGQTAGAMPLEQIVQWAQGHAVASGLTPADRT
ncbi:thioredoxin TrxC [Acidiphilium acidophilum]|uniref:thioredoxin TrxC n=1 Tax=Acidiphilium acidophilum TaxID=76588 RepID=UPI002E8E78B0|nr:thioredoxin TrxC [Acidiphilium acidophilum]